jgi:glycosyltransferase involved in cell wall biosynthesis
MLTYNRPQFLSRAIQSVVDQDFPDWELIVVHDGPNEKTAAIMTEWSKRDARIRYFRRPKGGNIANACNFGLSFARGEYVAILDDDDCWLARHKLAKQVAFLDNNRDYAGCGAGMTVISQGGCEIMSYLKPEQDPEIKRVALCANPMTHSTTMFRRSLGQSIGLYDESLAGFQDWDLWLRLGKQGKLYNFPEVFTGYTLWSGGGSFQQQRKNALSALRIVLRHRRDYSGFLAAFALATLHFAYAHLPYAVRRPSFSFLSRMKKTLFGQRSEPSRWSKSPACDAVERLRKQ